MISSILGRISFGHPKRHQIIFYASSPVDEQWIRSTCLHLARGGSDCGVFISGGTLDQETLGLYESHNVRVYSKVNRMDINMMRSHVIVTASSGLPRSWFPKNVQYRIHMPHSIASLHMIYTKDCFDGYDVLFAVGPHHAQEFKALSMLRGKNERPCFEVGYGKMDLLRQEMLSYNKRESDNKHILLAPSWGDQNILNTIGLELIGRLLHDGYKVTLRPHPLFFVDNDPLFNALQDRFSSHSDFCIEGSLGLGRAIFDADILITDYSGTAQEFAALRKEPVVFIDVAKKVLNPNWQTLNIVPIEIKSRDVLGPCAEVDIEKILLAVDDAILNRKQWQSKIENFIPNFLSSDDCAEAASVVLKKFISEGGRKKHA